MLINIRGTSGSGKSTAVRELVALATSVHFHVEGRKKPLYSFHRLENGKTFATLGHYETPCGGCDTLKKLDDVFTLYEKVKGEVDFVVAEGKILGDDTKRTPLVDKAVIMYLTTSVADCYAGVAKRRWDKGEHDKSFMKPRKLEADHRTIGSAVRRLRAAGKVKVVDVTRENIVGKILEEAGAV